MSAPAKSLFFRVSIALVCVALVSILAAGCSDNTGFKTTKTQATQTTKPSKTPTLSQPCSLLSAQTAASILGTTIKKLGNPESSEPDESTLRCRYSTTSDDGKLYLVLNVYVYQKQSAFELVKKVNKGKDIETSVDEGYYFDKTTSLQSERFVGARKSKTRIAVSASIAVIDPGEKLIAKQKTLPDVGILATQVGIILSKV